MLILTFTAGGTRYAVDVARVVELVPRVEIRPVPLAPAFLAGLLGYRGRVVPVIDLGLLLGTAPCPDRLSTRIVLVKSEPEDHNQGEDHRGGPSGESSPRPDAIQHGGLIGLIAEQVGDLTRVQPEKVVGVAVSLPQTPYLNTIAQTDQGFVPLIDVSQLSLVIGHQPFVLRSSAISETMSEGSKILEDAGESDRTDIP
jgi:chemotaxis-related protein WspB